MKLHICQILTVVPLSQVICTKVRDGDKRIVRLKEGEPRGRHVVIVDDLVQSGGTLKECQKLLSSQVSSCFIYSPIKRYTARAYPGAFLQLLALHFQSTQ